MLVVVKNLKNFLKQKKLRCSDKAIKSIEEELKKICLKASDNAVADGLKTVRPAHIPKLDFFLESSKKNDLKKPRNLIPE